MIEIILRHERTLKVDLFKATFFFKATFLLKCLKIYPAKSRTMWIQNNAFNLGELEKKIL